MQVILQSMAERTGIQRQTPRAGKLQAEKGLHLDSVPLFLDAEGETCTLETLPQIKQLMMLQVSQPTPSSQDC